MKDWYMSFAECHAEEESACLRRKVGAILVDEQGNIVFKGVNHAVHKEGCTQCLRTQLNISSGERHELCYALHAEVDVILKALRAHLDLSTLELHVTTMPCSGCAKIIVASGIKVVYYKSDYNDTLSQEILASIKLVKVE